MVDNDEVRARLERHKQELLRRAEGLRADMTHAEGPRDPDFAEQVVELEGEMVLSGISEATAAEIHQVNRALKRLDEGHYGECSRCGEPIDPRRLAALPFSDRCVSCAAESRN
jgi:DnaK suppressor protein